MDNSRARNDLTQSRRDDQIAVTKIQEQKSMTQSSRDTVSHRDETAGLHLAEIASLEKLVKEVQDLGNRGNIAKIEAHIATGESSGVNVLPLNSMFGSVTVNFSKGDTHRLQEVFWRSWLILPRELGTTFCEKAQIIHRPVGASQHRTHMATPCEECLGLIPAVNLKLVCEHHYSHATALPQPSLFREPLEQGEAEKI